MIIPVLVKILASLSIILIANKMIKNLAFSILAGTVTLALWSGHSISAIGSISWTEFYSIDNAMLSAIIFLVIWLSSQMAKAGIMRDLVDTIKVKLSVKGAIAVLPAIIGLLPMPGGAIFSAPLVDDCDENSIIDPALKTKINYWFRHIWEYTWPLYPGLILTANIVNLPIWQLFLLGLPMTVAAIATGYFFLLRKVKNQKIIKTKANKGIYKLISPIVVVIVVYIIILVFFPKISIISKYLPMSIGLLSAMILLQFERPLSMLDWKAVIINKKPVIMVIIVVLVSIYGAFIEARMPNGVLLMDQMRMELDDLGIPIIALIMIIPFVSGLTTGITVGFAGASIPIAISLLGRDPALYQILSTVSLAFSFGFMGVMMSPVHICLIVTNEHFKTSLAKSLISLLPLIITMLIFALIYSQIIIIGAFR
ncbi:MAG: DUF401 family protein [Spirochaetia bacterium]|jgi:integral membrane protein (TIGR00529 family)|nr:DUF401 family protein [Spirochaetia bacterium]